MSRYLLTLFSAFGLFLSNPVQATTVDFTSTDWDVQAALVGGSFKEASTGFDGSVMTFDTQELNDSGGYNLNGSINWVHDSAPLTTSVFVGQYDPQESILALLVTTIDSVAAVWTVFQAEVDPNGNYLVGPLAGIQGSDIEGIWYATAQSTASLTVVSLPGALGVFIGALGFSILMGRRKVQ